MVYFDLQSGGRGFAKYFAVSDVAVFIFNTIVLNDSFFTSSYNNLCNFSAVVFSHLHIITYVSWDFHRAFLELILWDKVSCKHFLVFMILFSVMFSLLCFLMCLSHRRFPNVVKQVILHVCLLVQFINNSQNILIDSSLPHYVFDSTS